MYKRWEEGHIHPINDASKTMRTYKTPYKAEKLNYGNDDEWLVTRRDDGKTLVVKGAGNRKAAIFLASNPKMDACWG